MSLPASKVTFLLTDIIVSSGAQRAALLRFDTSDEQLVLSGTVGMEDDVASELAIGERSHPWMVATLSLSPVVSESRAKSGGRIPFEAWTALPMPRPLYRGAPAIWPDSYATQVLAPLGARLVSLENRGFSGAPGGVVIVVEVAALD